MRTCVAQTHGPPHPTPSQADSGDLPRRCGASASNSARSVPARRDHASKHLPRKILQETVRTVSLPKKTCKTNKSRLTMLAVRLTVLTVRTLRTVSTKALQTADSLTALTGLTMIRAKILKKLALGKAIL